MSSRNSHTSQTDRPKMNQVEDRNQNMNRNLNTTRHTPNNPSRSNNNNRSQVEKWGLQLLGTPRG